MPTPPDLTHPLSLVLPDEPALPNRRIPRCKPTPSVPTADISLEKHRTALRDAIQRHAIARRV